MTEVEDLCKVKVTVIVAVKVTQQHQYFMRNYFCAVLQRRAILRSVTEDFGSFLGHRCY